MRQLLTEALEVMAQAEWAAMDHYDEQCCVWCSGSHERHRLPWETFRSGYGHYDDCPLEMFRAKARQALKEEGDE